MVKLLGIHGIHGILIGFNTIEPSRIWIRIEDDGDASMNQQREQARDSGPQKSALTISKMYNQSELGGRDKASG